MPRSIRFGLAVALAASLACDKSANPKIATSTPNVATPAPTQPVTTPAAPEDIPMNPSASRGAPPAIKPISKDGVRYESRWSDEGVLFAVDDKTGKPRWQVEVYKYRIDKQVETDVQVTFFKSMDLSKDGRTILIEDERGVRHAVDLETRAARTLNWPVVLRFRDSKPSPTGWMWRVDLEITNSLARVMKLDGPSVAERGELSNDLFAVKVDGKDVAYTGMMAKRAPPSRFIELKPGETFRTVVELGASYPVPPGPHRVEVAFRHTNHFSPDGFEMASKAVAFEL